MKIIKFLLFPLFFCGQLSAQESETTPIRFWNFAYINHNFSKAGLYLSGYVENDYIPFQRNETTYGRFSFGGKPLKWLKIGVNYVPLYESGEWMHFIEGEVVGTLRSGDFKVSVRERLRHGFTTGSNELRSRLKVDYSVPKSGFAPYISVEVFTWGTGWKKSRHYVGCTYSLTSWMQLDWYYMYYVFKSKDANHIFGLGLNFEI